MTVAIILLLVGAAVLLAMKHSASRAEPAGEVSPVTDAAVDRLEKMKQAFLAETKYLEQRWTERERAKQAGEPCDPKWWWDEPTERQLVRLRDDLASRGISMTLDPRTKGSVSDVIGLFEQPDEIDADVLKFFKTPRKGMTQSRARYEAARLIADPANKARWDSRPPDADLKEFFGFFGVELPKGTTFDQALLLRAKHERQFHEGDDPRLKEWDAWEQILSDLDDPETRDLYDIKRKPSRAQLKKLLDELKAEGHSIDDVSSDLELLAEKLEDAT
jgi:hypothetical protein